MGMIERKKSILLNEPHLATASGSVVTFDTDMRSRLKECKIFFKPVQSGSGTSSPSNVRPISGWTGLTVSRHGKNILNPDDVHDGYVKKDDSIGSGSQWHYTDYLEVTDEYTYTVSGSIVTGKPAAQFVFYNESKSKISSIHSGPSNFTFIPPTGTKYVRLSLKGDDPFQLEIGSNTTTYEPYTEITIPVSWQSEAGTLYGGYVDLVSGELIADKKLVHLDSNHGWTFNAGYMSYANRAYSNHIVTDAYSPLATNSILSDKFGCQLASGPHPYNACINSNKCFILGVPTTIDNLESFNEWLDNIGGIDVVYSINPITYQLTSNQLKTLRGINNIQSNADSVTIKYWTH